MKFLRLLCIFPLCLTFQSADGWIRVQIPTWCNCKLKLLSLSGNLYILRGFTLVEDATSCFEVYYATVWMWWHWMCIHSQQREINNGCPFGRISQQCHQMILWAFGPCNRWQDPCTSLPFPHPPMDGGIPAYLYLFPTALLQLVVAITNG